jgi:hypothetical protein
MISFFLRQPKVDDEDVEVKNMLIKVSLEIEEKPKPTFISSSMI